MKIIVAIDGHSSCGKSTMAKDLARTVNYIYVDTGAMYRAVTLYCLREGIFKHQQLDEALLRSHLDHISITFKSAEQGGLPQICLNGENVESEIRGMRVANAVSIISASSAVRRKMVALQQSMGKEKGIVMDGRDIGTVVFPAADLKVFVTASAATRAQRRYDELMSKGQKVSFDEILENVKERDRLDENRAESPLRRADDALLLDNGDLTIEEQNDWLKAEFVKASQPGCIEINIDEDSGFCFGVVNAIAKAEQELTKGVDLYCLGDIVHNSNEVDRLAGLGMRVVDHKGMSLLKNKTMLLRAHGEPPLTYQVAKEKGIEIIDATCPVVLGLQTKIRKAHKANPDAQIVIYGKEGHAEVNGLVGQTGGKAIVVEHPHDTSSINFEKDIILFAQTTKPIDGFNELVAEIEKRRKAKFSFFDTICRQVSNRREKIRDFADSHDLILFVSDKKSSNGKVLFEECKSKNENTYFMTSTDKIQADWLKGVSSVGICGATSTPKWQMENIKNELKTIIS